jgi:glycosyltransferase involved in cell wall biosynthesis
MGLHIAIAARDLGRTSTGPSNYIYGLIEGLLQVNQNHEIHIYYRSPEARGLFPSAHEHYLPAANIMLWDHWALPSALKRDGVDVTIFPKGTLPIWFPGKALTIVLDLGYFYPDLGAYKMVNTLYMKFALRASSQRAWGIFTISEHTRQDVIRLFHIPAEKTLNIYGACRPGYRPVTDPKMLTRVRREQNLREPFIFFPSSSISPRKNFSRLLDAFESIAAKIPHHLYITGWRSWRASGTLARLEGQERVHRLGLIPLEDMATLYTLAEFTIYPSLFEGLGIPVLEAFQCGSPVLTTKQTSLPEVAGDAALLVDGYNTADLAEGILRLASQPDLRAAYRQKGFERVKGFRWEITAAKVLDWIEAHR